MTTNQPTIAQPRVCNESPQVLLIKCLEGQGLSPVLIPVDFPLRAAYFNSSTLQCERTMPIRFSREIYITASSKFPGWSYIQIWDAKARSYACSCVERRSGGCKHDSRLRDIQGITSF